jgi:penicillin-binding protein 2
MYQDPWQGGETLSTAIGQSYILVTPLQVLVMISAIANDGKLFAPQLVKQIEDYRGNTLRNFPSRVVSEIPVSPQSIHIIKEALRRVVHGPRGTGRIAQIDGVEMAGKTGTAQVASLPLNNERSDIPFHLRDHAWFAAFAPVEKPEIAVVVLVEHGGSGSSTAGPLAKEVIAHYLSRASR